MFFKDWDKIAGKKPSKDSWEYLVFPRHEIAEIGVSLVEWDYKSKKIKRMESTIMANVGDEEHVRDGLDKLGSFGWELVSIDIQIIGELDKTIQSYFISRPYGKDEFIFKRKKSK